MLTIMRKMSVLLLLCINTAFSGNLANPAISLPDARLSIGASYHVAGLTISNDSVPCLLNQINLRLSYAPTQIFNLGIEVGTAQMEVDSSVTAAHQYGVFHGRFGLSAGAHLKLSTPWLARDKLAIIGIVNGSWFSSENQNKVLYSGIDGTAAAGIQFHIKHFGFISVGPRFNYLQGTNRSEDGTEGSWSNRNNLQGWLAIDLLPKMNGVTMSGRPYISLETAVTPDVSFGGRVPIREISFSIAVGAIANRLYGEENDVEWDP